MAGEPLLEAVRGSMDVKGVGTAAAAEVTDAKRSGLLGLSDALLELLWQRLIQRLLDLQGHSPHEGASDMATVQTYAIIDTGLRYADDTANPATGVVQERGERCALAVRQRQSRLLASYDRYSFSGNLDVRATRNGHGRALCELLYRCAAAAQPRP